LEELAVCGQYIPTTHRLRRQLTMFRRKLLSPSSELESNHKSAAIPAEYICLLVIPPCKAKAIPAHTVKEYVEVISTHS
jgi:hypothetical protein